MTALRFDGWFNIRRLPATVALAAFVLASAISGAQAPAAPPAGAPPAPVAPAAPDDKPEFPKFEEVTKDMKVTEGFLTLYHDEKTDKLLVKIPASMLKKNLFWATSIAAGRNYAGWQWNDGAVYFERVGKQLVLMEADPRYNKPKADPVGDVIVRTYTDNIIKAVPIATLAGQDPVIDLGDLLMSDLVGLGQLYNGTFDRGLSRYESIRDFPKNLEIAVNAAIMGKTGGQYATVHYSISELPENNGYAAREADARIGYFLTVQKDWAAKRDAKTLFNRYVNRWRLRKAQPDAPVSDVLPEDQIVFYIEKTVPVQYRQYVREGILEWNKAFEAAGLRNAVVVHQQTDTVHADKDPEDARYNFFRWIVSGQPFAMGPSRVNPFTGQILDADIIFDDSYIRYWTNQFTVHGPAPVAAYTDGPVNEFLAHHPQWGVGNEASTTMTTAPAGSSFESPDADPSPTALAHFDAVRGGTWGTPKETHLCEMAVGAARQLAFASVVLASNGKRNLPDEFIGQAIKETVMHEVGHVLGLRHNFKGSSWHKLSEMRNGTSDPNHQLTGSVMDYNPYIYGEAEEEQGYFSTPTVGPYDMWAIEYGYRPFSASKEEGAAKDEKEMLKKVASRCAEPGLDYATDEDTSFFYPDPLVNRWDNGKDPIEFARYQTTTAERLWKDGLKGVVPDGKSQTPLRRAFSMTLGEYGFGGMVAARQVGGQYVHRDAKGDPNGRSPIEIVPAEKQREALKFAAEKMLATDSFKFPPELLNSLAPGRWGHWDSDEFDNDLTFDVHRAVLNAQARVLFQLMNPFTLNRVHDAELKVTAEADAVTVVEVLRTVTESVWSEVAAAPAGGPYTDRRPMVGSFRRALQRDHLQRMIDIVLSRPGSFLNADVHAVARLTLKDLGTAIDAAVARGGGNIDDYTRAHLTDSRQRITQALNAEFVAAQAQRNTGGGRRIVIGAE